MHRPLASLSVLLLAACGGGGSQSSATAPVTSAPVAASTAPAPAGSASAASSAAAPAEAYDDPSESAVAIDMPPLVKKGTPKSAFPKATIPEKGCYRDVQFSGQHAGDFAALVDKCGKPAGLLEYVKPAEGKLHHVKDKRDTFSVKLLGGYCYRYFAVADSTIKDIDILVQKPGGAIVASDQQTQPVAIIDFEKAWCMDDDATYEFHVEVDGVGHGAYTFGIWTRPK